MRAFSPSWWDAIVRGLLASADYRAITALIVLSLMLLAVLFRTRHGFFPTLANMLRIAEAFGILASGLLIGTVFLFTNPPAVEILSPEMRVATGLVGLLASLHVGLTAIREAMKGPRRRRRIDKVKSAKTLGLPR